MGTKIHLSSLILCVILSQAIIVLAEENINKSSDLHIRKKRLIDRTPHGNRPKRIDEVPYITSLRKNSLPLCGANILSPEILITAAHCFSAHEQGVTYNILAGSAYRNFGSYHAIKNLQLYPQYNANGHVHDLALIYVHPPIKLVGSYNQKIDFYNGTLHPGMSATLSGWGCTKVEGGRVMFPKDLRSIEVPILSPFDCHNANEIVNPYNNQYICTADTWGNKGSCYGDGGGPLVINGLLAGIMTWNKIPSSSKQHPDVFMNLAYSPYREWIISTMRHFEHIGG